MVTLTDILAKDNLTTAYEQVVRKGGRGGVDGMSVEELGDHLRATWAQTRILLENGQYRPSAVRRVEIPKPDGGVRLLGIPTVQDRMLQQGIAQQLSGYYEVKFSEYSYGFRPGRGCHDAVEQALAYLNEGYAYVVEVDLSKFFDRVKHDRLMHRLSQDISDKEVLRLLQRCLRSSDTRSAQVTAPL
ncbi:MAG: reverse transcriptase domain-containing protein [Bacteroidota bacterium]